jgi:hypothetical protein
MSESMFEEGTVLSNKDKELKKKADASSDLPEYSKPSIGDEVIITYQRTSDTRTWGNARGKIVNIEKAVKSDTMKAEPQYEIEVLDNNDEFHEKGAVVVLYREEFLDPEEYEGDMSTDYTVERRSELKKKADNGEGEEEMEPQEDDAFFESTGSLGSMTSVSVGGKFLGEYDSEEEAEQALKEWMEKNNFRPNVWTVSDHGNIHPRTLDASTKKPIKKESKGDKQMDKVIKKADYQGWKNYETWAVALWIDNEQGSQDAVLEQVRELKDPSAIADYLKDMIEDANPLMEEPSLYSDLLGAAISEVDWYELANNYINQIKEEKEYQDEERKKWQHISHLSK